MADYKRLLETHGWCPGPDASAEYTTFLLDTRRWLKTRPYLDETDRLGILYWLALLETIRRFGVPSKSDNRGRDSMFSVALAAARYHEGFRSWEGQKSGFADCINRIDGWHRDRFLPSVRRGDDLLAELPEERFGAQLIHGVLDAEPFASFIVWYSTSIPDGEHDSGKKQMSTALKVHDSEAHDGSTRLSDEDMAKMLNIVEALASGGTDRSLFYRDPTVPLGERAPLVLDPDHAANALRTRVGSADPKRTSERARPAVSIEAARDDESRPNWLEPEDRRNLQAIDHLAQVEQLQQIASALEALRMSSTPGTARHALLSTEGLVLAVVLGERTQVDAARTLELEVDTVGKAVQRIVRDLRDEVAA